MTYEDIVELEVEIYYDDLDVEVLEDYCYGESYSDYGWEQDSKECLVHYDEYVLYHLITEEDVKEYLNSSEYQEGEEENLTEEDMLEVMAEFIKDKYYEQARKELREEVSKPSHDYEPRETFENY